MQFMLYPTFTLVGDRGIIPCIRLPLNYRELVPRFYEQGGKNDVEKYCDQLATMLKPTQFSVYVPVRLRWDDQHGLRNICVGPSAGLDLVEQHGWPGFQEHNIGTASGFVAAAVATQYVTELLKSEA